MKYLYLFLIILSICIVFKIFKRLIINLKIKKAGKQGEKFVGDILKKIKHKDDYILSNIKLHDNKRQTELDKVVINRHGVFVIEVKNYSGKIRGKENDEYWIKYKENDYKGLQTKKINNPLKQLNREIGILNNYFHKNKINIYIKGCVYMVNANRPFLNDRLINHPGELDKYIHNSKEKILTSTQINMIVKLLKKHNY